MSNQASQKTGVNKMKTKITQIGFNRCTVEMDNAIFGEREVTEFYAPHAGGYVRRNNNQQSQVCDGLASTGETLVWNAKTPLIELIRREYKKMMRENAKWADQ